MLVKGYTSTAVAAAGTQARGISWIWNALGHQEGPVTYSPFPCLVEPGVHQHWLWKKLSFHWFPCARAACRGNQLAEHKPFHLPFWQDSSEPDQFLDLIHHMRAKPAWAVLERLGRATFCSKTSSMDRVRLPSWYQGQGGYLCTPGAKPWRQTTSVSSLKWNWAPSISLN